MIGGFVDRVAWIDLSSGDVELKPLDDEDVRKYVGARGLGVKYVLDNGPEVDPLSPDNLLCVMNGPLTGTEVKMSGRLAVVTKSPLDRHGHRQPHGRLDRSQAQVGRLRRSALQGQGRWPRSTPMWRMGKVTLYDASDRVGNGDRRYGHGSARRAR